MKNPFKKNPASVASILSGFTTVAAQLADHIRTKDAESQYHADAVIEHDAARVAAVEEANKAADVKLRIEALIGA